MSTMADSESSSESSTSSSDFSDFEETIGGNVPVNEVEPFYSIQPWRFEPPGRAVETQEREENIEPPRRRCELESEEW